MVSAGGDFDAVLGAGAYLTILGFFTGDSRSAVYVYV